MRQQRIDRHKPQTAPQIIDDRQPKIPPPPTVDPAVADLPLRTVLYVEVGDMEPAKIQLLVQSINEMYEGAKGGLHYVVPIRGGKIGSDVMFEAEFLRVVRELCEIKDNQIILKDGAQECNITRYQV
jgi:hypothetical protein